MLPGYTAGKSSHWETWMAFCELQNDYMTFMQFCC